MSVNLGHSTLDLSSIHSFRKVLSQAKHPIALAGAGLSAASGIPTFRGAGGLWRQNDALSLATPQAFRADPSKVWQFYHYRRSTVLKSDHNLAHITLAKLLIDHASIRSQIMPNAQSFHLITQNVDGLSQRAVDQLRGISAPQNEAKESVRTQTQEPHLNLVEMHGNLFKTICTRCSHIRVNLDNPICQALAGTESLELDYRAVPSDQLPRCLEPHCGGLLRPGVVWFGEAIPELDRIEPLIQQCDLILVLGTSSSVYPAAGFAHQIKRSNRGKVAVFNIDTAVEHIQDQEMDWYFQGPVEQTLPEVLGI